MVKEGGGTKILFLAVQRELTRTNNHSALVSDDKKKKSMGLGMYSGENRDSVRERKSERASEGHSGSYKMTSSSRNRNTHN